jgi:hypothetical protein
LGWFCAGVGSINKEGLNAVSSSAMVVSQVYVVFVKLLQIEQASSKMDHVLMERKRVMIPS